MTQQEALAEAQRRWGDEAEAYIDITGLHYVQACPLAIGRYGFGNSWEAAVADADRRETS